MWFYDWVMYTCSYFIIIILCIWMSQYWSCCCKWDRWRIYSWNHDVNVWSWWCSCDCDCGVLLGIILIRSVKLTWIALPHANINIGLGFHVAAQRWDQISTFGKLTRIGCHVIEITVLLCVPWEEQLHVLSCNEKNVMFLYCYVYILVMIVFLSKDDLV